MSGTHAGGATVGVIGAGAWGTALAIVLAQRGFDVGLWVYEADLCGRMQRTRVNDVYLPGIPLPAPITLHTDLAATVRAAGLVVMAVPSHALRATLPGLAAHVRTDAPLVLATKGLEEGSLMRVSEVALDSLGSAWRPRLATLSGPTFAREIALGEPAAVVVAAYDAALGARLQTELSSPRLRLYRSADVVGVELAAALKNVIAIASGICQGLGLGSNTRAALITRGLAEIGRLVLACGGRAETVAGLAGLGDLVLTCTGELSRNRSLGIALGQGQSLAAIMAATPTVAEGVRTSKAAVELAGRHGVEMPITDQMHRVLFAGKAPQAALDELMLRALKAEV